MRGIVLPDRKHGRSIRMASLASILADGPVEKGRERGEEMEQGDWIARRVQHRCIRRFIARARVPIINDLSLPSRFLSNSKFNLASLDGRNCKNRETTSVSRVLVKGKFSKNYLTACF